MTFVLSNSSQPVRVGRWLACLLLLSLPFNGGCRKELKDVADQHVSDDLLGKHEKREALPFFEANGRYYELEGTPQVDQEIVVPMLKKLRDVAPTEQWVMLRPEKKNSAYALLVELPKDRQLVDRMAETVQEADEKFSGFILQQWGRKWLLMDLIDKESYEFLKKNDPDIDKQR